MIEKGKQLILSQRNRIEQMLNQQNRIKKDYSEEDKILVQDIIDLYYINNENKLILVDYKTDYKKGRRTKLN